VSRGVQNGDLFCIRLEPQQPEELLQLLSFPSQDRTQREALSGSARTVHGLAPAATVHMRIA